MTKLQKGSLYISKEDILNTLGLTEDTVITGVKDSGDGIEINVIANGENKQDWLVDNTDNNWNLRRKKLNVSDSEGKVSGFVSGGVFSGSIEQLTSLDASEIILSNEQVKRIADELKNANITINTTVSSESDAKSFAEEIVKNLKRTKGMR